MSHHPLVVSRQSYWHAQLDGSDGLAVELATRADVASPDAIEIVGHYDDPREAAAAALEAARAWAARRGDDGRVPVVIVTTDLVPPVLDDAIADDELHKWAERRYQAMPRCDHCGAVPASAWVDPHGVIVGACSESCVEAYVSSSYVDVDEDEAA